MRMSSSVPNARRASSTSDTGMGRLGCDLAGSCTRNTPRATSTPMPVGGAPAQWVVTSKHYLRRGTALPLLIKLQVRLNNGPIDGCLLRLGRLVKLIGGSV